MVVHTDSIFKASLRGFCKVFFPVIGVFFAFFLSGLLIYSVSSSSTIGQEKTVLNILPDLNGDEELKAADSPVILRVNIHGMIGVPKELDTKVIENILRDSRRGVLKDNRVKGILLHLNTPGGGVFDSANIYQMLNEYKKKYNMPIYAYVNGVCASGGMYVSSAADRTFASPASVVGSIGVLSTHFFNFSEMLNKIGVQSKTLIQGLDKDAMNPFREWKPNEEAAIEPIMSYFYSTFVDVVTASRPRLDKNKLVNEYGAKIFDAPTGAELGFIDMANVDYKTALGELMIAANIDSSKPYQVVELTPKNVWLEKLLEGGTSMFSGKVEHVISIGWHQPSAKIQDQFAYLFNPGLCQ